MNARKTLRALEWAEVDSHLDADCRRVLRQERLSLQAAMETAEALIEAAYALAPGPPGERMGWFLDRLAACGIEGETLP